MNITTYYYDTNKYAPMFCPKASIFVKEFIKRFKFIKEVELHRKVLPFHTLKTLVS